MIFLTLSFKRSFYLFLTLLSPPDSGSLPSGVELVSPTPLPIIYAAPSYSLGNLLPLHSLFELLQLFSVTSKLSFD